jgi:hypothetical protein
MLTPSESAKIVRDRIRLVGGFKGTIALTDQLQAVGIDDPKQQDSLKIEISTNTTIGVPSKNHTIAITDLSFDGTTLVSEVRNQVADNAKPS